MAWTLRRWVWTPQELRIAVAYLPSSHCVIDDMAVAARKTTGTARCAEGLRRRLLNDGWLCPLRKDGTKTIYTLQVPPSS